VVAIEGVEAIEGRRGRQAVCERLGKEPAGLYDGSGGWAWHVGLPAKSGVGGGIVAIAPGKGAIAVFAPPLDEAGNSVKAQKVIEYVAQKLNYNLYSPESVGWKSAGKGAGGTK